MRHPQYKFANYFIQRAKSEGSSLTHMQIQKLVYYTHGYLLAKKGQSPITIPFEAWDNGPVNPELFHSLKANRSLPIEQLIVDQSNLPIKLENDELGIYQDILDDVWTKYGGLHAWTLSNLTHAPGSPWSQIYQPGIRSLQIDDQIIKNYFNDQICK